MKIDQAIHYFIHYIMSKAFDLMHELIF